MVLCQMMEGLYEDAEGQIELLSVMHSSEDLSPEFKYLQATLCRYRSNATTGSHLSALDECREWFFKRANAIPPFLFPFRNLVAMSPDFLMRLAVSYPYPYLPILIPSHSRALLLTPFSSLTPYTPYLYPQCDYLQFLDSSPPPPLFPKNHPVDDPSAERPQQTETPTEPIIDLSPAAKIGMDLVDKVLKNCPGMSCVYIEQARALCSMEMYDDAQRALSTCLAFWPHCSAALVSMAYLETRRLNTAAANRAIEQALSCDFSIRGSTLFRLVQVYVRAQQGRLDEAIAEMEQLMGMPEIRSSNPMDAIGLSDGGMDGGYTSGKGTYADSLRLSEDDRVGAFVTYAALLAKTRRLKEANKILSEAKVSFAGSKQEVQILIASSQLAVERNDFDTAIRVLDKIPPSSPIFPRAQIIKADIFLIHNRDKEGYVNCYQNLVNADNTSRNYSLLGDAYLKILQPESAVEALEEAYRLDPSNTRLRGRIGKALVSTHEYHRAVDFYEAAIRDVTKASGNSSECIHLSRDLAKLYSKLSRVDSAVRCLQRVIGEDSAERDLATLRLDVSSLLLVVELLAPKDGQSQNIEEITKTLLRAKEAQLLVAQQTRTSNHVMASTIERERALLSTIFQKLGCMRVADDNKAAEKDFEDAIQYNGQNLAAMSGLAQVYRERGEVDQCIRQCKKIITAGTI